MVNFRFYLPFILIFALFFYSLASDNQLLLIMIISVVILGVVIYYLKSIYEIFTRWKKDKDEGELDAIVEYIGTVYQRPVNISRGSYSPGFILGQFKVISFFCEDKYKLVNKVVSLEGDNRDSNLVIGNRYKVKMKIHSRKLVYIEACKS